MPKNAVNALWRCRKHCCNGTDDTAPRYDSSSVLFHALSIAEVSA
ncbi:hypothetical protein SACE_5843 [Saccharopolyspora erythraea NRRL 2338]|uniref:Uncharacterized protein n=1 Tax=Saccharopolyspora erythraea (strain ATCC 11635 / DSM 40517 / JCM 4748 / NBRC 13426 / NCIMB 8594 / NRRL 2338) TaxID=405948 RepID=A4FLV2_SACEN|nr:hypothetical protein SACE_5843 [Saccharopolyspora erythraea NRRL 2338]